MAVNFEEELHLLNQICVDNAASTLVKPPPAPRVPQANEKYLNLTKYLEDKCENLIKLLDRSTFYQLGRPVIIAFNHFLEKCYYHTKWLDIIYELSLKYGEQIEFIVADQIDLDIVYFHKNPADFLMSLHKPEDESLQIFAIDEKKRIRRLELSVADNKALGTLLKLCEKLIQGTLYISQSLVEGEQNKSLVKVCVHCNYEELVVKSTKDLFLIIGLEDYSSIYEGRGPNYELIAAHLKDYNVDTVFINGLKNYIPFEFINYRYPQLVFIPRKNKEQFLHYSGRSRNTESILEFLIANLGAQGEQFRQNELKKIRYKSLNFPPENEINFENLNAYIQENYPKSVKVLNRQTFYSIQTNIVIYFMDFREKGLRPYMETLKIIYNVALAKYGYGVEYLIADLQDMDIIYPKWYNQKYLNNLVTSDDSVHCFKIDRIRRKYKIQQFKTSSSLYYHLYYFNYTRLYYSQAYPKFSKNDLVSSCVADNLNSFLSKSKKDIFLTIYWSSYESSLKLLNTLNAIAKDLKKTSVKMLKMNAELNYVPLEYKYHTYPVHFFIPSHNRDEGTIRYISVEKSREELLGFIRQMLHDQ